MAAEPGLRARKKIQSRRRIESAAIELFERDGFREASVKDIAAAADIAPRTFFLYFETKEDVVLADYAGRLERIVAELSRRPAKERPWDALRASFIVVAADYESERAALVRRFRIMAANPSVQARSLQLQAGWEDKVTLVLARRMGRDAAADLVPRLLASAAMTAIRTSLRHWIANRHEDRLPKLVEASFEQLGAGLGGLK